MVNEDEEAVGAGAVNAPEERDAEDSDGGFEKGEEVEGESASELDEEEVLGEEDAYRGMEFEESDAEKMDAAYMEA